MIVCICFAGVEVKFKNVFYEVLIFPAYVPELNGMSITEKGLVIGAAVTLAQLDEKLRELVKELPGRPTNTRVGVITALYICSAQQTKVFSAILEMLRWFAGQQIRNVSVGA